MTFAANLVRLLHLALVLFVVAVPFLGGNPPWSLFAVHCMTVITLVVHWLTKQNACFLTLVESSLRGIPSTQSFMHSIVSPVYSIEDIDLKYLVHRVTPVLGIISALRLSSRWDVMKDDLAKCYKAARVQAR